MASESDPAVSHVSPIPDRAEANERKELKEPRKAIIQWQEYFMGIAILAAKRSKNPHEQVGSCIINGQRQLAGIGCNCFPRMKSRDEVAVSAASNGTEMKNRIREVRKYECPAAINAIISSNVSDLRGCTLYITDFPCNKSAQAIVQSGIRDVVYLSDTHKGDIDEDFIGAKRIFDECGVKYARFVLAKSQSEVYQNEARLELKLQPDGKAAKDWQLKYLDNPPVNKDRPVGSHCREGHMEWDELLMAIAVLASRRSKDPDVQVGCCIASDEDDDRQNRITGVGWNGMPTGFFDSPAVWNNPRNDPFNSKRTYICHAESNAVIRRTSASLHGCTAYVTLFPCNTCAQILIHAGVKKVVYLSDEKFEKDEFIIGRQQLESAGVELTPFSACRSDSEVYQRESVQLNFTSVDLKPDTDLPVAADSVSQCR